MRKVLALAALLVFFVLSFPAGAQQQAGSFFTGVNPQNIINQPVNTSQALAPMNFGNAFRPPKPPQTFTLSRFFPKITVAPWPPKMPSLNLFKAPTTPAPVNPQQAFPAFPSIH